MLKLQQSSGTMRWRKREAQRHQLCCCQTIYPMPAVTHLWISCSVRNLTPYWFNPSQSGCLLFATLTTVPNNHNKLSLTECLLWTTHYCILYVVCVLRCFILMAILWSRHCYYSNFVDKETKAQLIWLAHSHTVYKGFISSIWLLNLHSSANSILSSETLNPFQLKSRTR